MIDLNENDDPLLFRAQVPAGSYQLRVSATDGTRAISATALTPAQVIGVSQAADGIRLDLAGRAGVAASAVKAIL